MIVLHYFSLIVLVLSFCRKGFVNDHYAIPL
jgi:hypothetical protein